MVGDLVAMTPERVEKRVWDQSSVDAMPWEKLGHGLDGG